MAKHHGISRIISGGQTGADIAGIDVAIELGIDYGGSIPAGRKTEAGILPERYNKIIELETTSYPARTEKNIIDSDATIIFTYNKMGSGSELTIRLARRHKKPYLHINLEKKTDSETINEVTEWLNEVKPTVLNVAGSRESMSPGIYSRVYNIMEKCLE